MADSTPRAARRAPASLAVLAAVAALALTLAVPGRAEARTAQDPAPATRSGLPWRSGVHPQGGDPGRAQRFAEWRGRPLDVAVLWTDRATWTDLIDAPLYDAWAGIDVTRVLGMPMWPTGLDGSTQACAAGDYDDEWHQIGTALQTTGHADDTIIRLAWEFNGTWYPWSAYDAESWMDCWRRIVTVADGAAPGLRWDWNTNAGWTALTPDASDLWPGDEYVDIVGVDSYDHWPTAVDEQTWYEGQYLGTARLKHWLDFAIAHDKQLSVPEWGVFLAEDEFGTLRLDNDLYVEQMHGFFAANAEHIAYESYFNESSEGHRGSLVEPVQAPKAAAAYLAAYRPTTGPDPDPDPDPDPEEGSATVGVTVEVAGPPVEAGALRLVTSDVPVDLGATELAVDLQALEASGPLGPVEVVDDRPSDPGWDLSIQATDLTSSAGDALGAERLGIAASLTSAAPGQAVTVAEPVAPGLGLGVPRVLASAPAGAGRGTAVLAATVDLSIPTSTPSGTYTGLVTLTVI